MSATKNQLNQIIDNQTQLVEKLTGFAKEATKFAVVDETAVAEGKAIFNEYTAKNKELFEAMMKPESAEKLWEKLPANYSKAIALQTEYFNKTADFYKNMFSNSAKAAQDTALKVTDLYKNSYEAMSETSAANMKLVKEYWA
ncbi:MAG: hypothetical protein JNL70_27765 [Saprospiraceae bacterium]|nr:hypothetical protein [Saprospiraceae bacterium]